MGRIIDSGFGRGSSGPAEDGGGGGDGRAVITKTYSITLAQLQAQASTTHTFDLWTMDADEAILWCWMENAGAAFSGGGVGGVYVELGRSGDVDGLYIQREMTDAGKIEDDSANHGTDLGAYAEMGDAGAGHDGSTYYDDEYDIVAKVTSTSANMDGLTAGGPLHLHFLVVRVDSTQIAAATP